MEMGFVIYCPLVIEWGCTPSSFNILCTIFKWIDAMGHCLKALLPKSIFTDLLTQCELALESLICRLTVDSLDSVFQGEPQSLATIYQLVTEACEQLVHSEYEAGLGSLAVCNLNESLCTDKQIPPHSCCDTSQTISLIAQHKCRL